MFEWMCSENFGDVVKIIRKVITGEHVAITRKDTNKGNDYLDDTNIYTSHYYGNNLLPDIFKRRSQRFVDDILSGRVLFIREDHSISIEQLQEFKRCVETLNPSLKYILLLLTRAPLNDETHVIENVLIKSMPKDIDEYNDHIKHCINQLTN